jgi:hypothetical protein
MLNQLHQKLTLWMMNNTILITTPLSSLPLQLFGYVMVNYGQFPKIRIVYGLGWVWGIFQPILTSSD